MAKKKFIDTLWGNFVKHFVYSVMVLYTYELTQGLDPFHFDMALLSKLYSAGLVAAMPTLQNYFNPNDKRFGMKATLKKFPTEPTKITDQD